MARSKKAGRRAAADPVVPASCRAIKDDGEPCQVKRGISKDGLCLWHDPKRAAKRKAAQKKGGRIAGQRTRDPLIVPQGIETLDDCVIWSAWVAQAVATGGLDPKRGGEVIRAVNTFMKAFEKRDLEGQVRELQAQLKKLKKGG